MQEISYRTANCAEEIPSRLLLTTLFAPKDIFETSLEAHKFIKQNQMSALVDKWQKLLRMNCA